MKKILYYFSALTLIMLLLWACEDDKIDGDDEELTIPHETLVVNEWIKDNMELYYYWNDKMPTNIDFTKEADSKAYFDKLLYKEKDKWSFITDDYPAFKAERQGIPVTMGYSPAFYLVSSTRIVAVVKYVYPGSPADEAGLKRGDIILSINNTELDISNYYDLYSRADYSVQLGKLENSSFNYSGQSLSMTARVTLTDPAIYNKVFDIDGHKIGYLVYVEFISGEEGKLLLELDTIFNEFKAQGITDLVVDLRYNPGGDIDAAVHLASQIAPFAVMNNSELLISLQYNSGLQDYLESDDEYKDMLYEKFKVVSSNIDMDRVYFLTTSGSASASELVITGLEPYMDVIQIGDSTYGKYAGAWVLPDDNEQWAIIPVVMKYANADGYTDFADGLIPDYEMEDDVFDAVPFGDPSDPMLAKAIELATGKSFKSKRLIKSESLRFQEIIPVEMSSKSNLILTLPVIQESLK